MIVVFCVRLFVKCYQCDHITLSDAGDDINKAGGCEYNLEYDESNVFGTIEVHD